MFHKEEWRPIHVKQYSKPMYNKCCKGYKSLENRAKVRVRGHANIPELRIGDWMGREQERLFKKISE